MEIEANFTPKACVSFVLNMKVVNYKGCCYALHQLAKSLEENNNLRPNKSFLVLPMHLT